MIAFKHTLVLPMLAFTCAAGMVIVNGAHSSTATASFRDGGDLHGVPLLVTAPADAIEIDEAMKSAKQGEPIAVRGRIERAKDAFDQQQAIFILTDDVAAAAHWTKDDKAVETSPVSRQHKAIVQLVDSSGAPLSETLEGKGGLKHGAEVFVQGVVSGTNNTDLLVINPTAMHVPKVAVPPGFLLRDRPSDAINVTAARASSTVKKGDRIVLHGVIGGSHEPFVSSRAMFTVVGDGLKPCNANPEDRCETPWDYCCDPPAEIAANSATIRVVDAKGKVLRTDLKGRAGMKELSEVLVVGVASVVEKGVLIVDAEAMYVARR